MESKLLELKAKVEFLDDARKKLRDMRARYVGTIRQIDTYFNAPKGRLKLREIEGRATAELIYYEREDVPGPKRSKVLILEILEPKSFRTLFERILGKKVVIDKKREIYMYKGTQIHLDTVKNLGTFIEFERKTKELLKDREHLEELKKKLEIKDIDLLTGSYSEMALENKSED